MYVCIKYQYLTLHFAQQQVTMMVISILGFLCFLCIAGVDYQTLNQNLVFAAGSSPGIQQTVFVVLLDDNIAEDIESFNIQATSEIPQTLFINQAVGQIIDNDGKSATSAAVSYNINYYTHDSSNSVRNSLRTNVFFVTVCQIGFEQSSSTVIEGSNNGMEEVCLVKLNTGSAFLETDVTVLISTGSGNKTGVRNACRRNYSCIKH